MKIKTDNYEIYKGDCLELMKNILKRSRRKERRIIKSELLKVFDKSN